MDSFSQQCNMDKGWQLELYGYYTGPVQLYGPADM